MGHGLDISDINVVDSPPHIEPMCDILNLPGGFYIDVM